MKQDRLILTAGFMPAAVMALLLLAENLLGQGVLPNHILVLAAMEVGVYFLPILLLRLLKDDEGKRAVFRCRHFKHRAVWFVLWMSLAVDKDGSAAHIVEARYQIAEGGLARAARTNYGDVLAAAYLKGQPLQYEGLSLFIYNIIRVAYLGVRE